MLRVLTALLGVIVVCFGVWALLLVLGVRGGPLPGLATLGAAVLGGWWGWRRG